MRYYKQQLVFSASDLVTFVGCRHATVLDRRQLDAPVPVAEDDEYLKLLQEKGLEHERNLRDRLNAEGRQVLEIAQEGTLEDRAARTRQAMLAGAGRPGAAWLTCRSWIQSMKVERKPPPPAEKVAEIVVKR